MSPRIVIALSVLAAVLAADAARAGTPLPNPPFTGGGFTAPTKDVLKQEEYASRLLAGYLKKRVACDRYAIIGLQLAYEPANAPKVPAVQAKWQACVAKADVDFRVKRDRLVLKGMPACLDAAAMDAQRAVVDQLLAALVSQIYCDAGAAAPDPVTGLDVPDAKQAVVGETSVAKIALKANLRASKCYAKAAGVVFKGGGVLDPLVLPKLLACFDAVALEVAEDVGDLEQRQKLPACLPAPAAVAAADLAVLLASNATAAVYCSSPSGAFVDGLPTL